MKIASNGPKFVLLLALPAMSYGADSAQQTFRNPEDAANALLIAMEVENDPLFLSIVGAPMASLWNSGDPERDSGERNRYLDAARRNGFTIRDGTANRKIILMGGMEEPFPAPLMKTEAGWRFDGEEGSSELAIRRIRRNEIAAVELCRRFREAEFEFRGSDRDGPPAFAQKIRSTPGQHDGLVWFHDEVDESPLGPPFAAAEFSERRLSGQMQPLFGYYFKILVAQGPAAPGGALDYRVNGRLSRGFALIAWPARYGVDGLRSFLINHFGDVYQKDLGAGTGGLAPGVAAFNPDPSWTRLEGYEPTEELTPGSLRPN